jgi:hypothetical protein
LSILQYIPITKDDKKDFFLFYLEKFTTEISNEHLNNATTVMSTVLQLTNKSTKHCKQEKKHQVSKINWIQNSTGKL